MWWNCWFNAVFVNILIYRCIMHFFIFFKRKIFSNWMWIVQCLIKLRFGVNTFHIAKDFLSSVTLVWFEISCLKPLHMVSTSYLYNVLSRRPSWSHICSVQLAFDFKRMEYENTFIVMNQNFLKVIENVRKYRTLIFCGCLLLKTNKDHMCWEKENINSMKTQPYSCVKITFTYLLKLHLYWKLTPSINLVFLRSHVMLSVYSV